MPDIDSLYAPTGTSSLETATLALRLEHLNARLQAANVARLGAGSATLFQTSLEPAYDALRAAAASSGDAVEQREAVARQLDVLANAAPAPTPADASLDDLVLAVNQASSRYKLLADVIARQYNLVELSIRGTR